MYVVLGLPPFWQPGNKDVLPVVAFLPFLMMCAANDLWTLYCSLTSNIGMKI